jgi:hypothetical protein
MKKTKNREVYGDNIIYTSENTRQILKTDSIVDGIVDKFIDRSRVGKAKYNTDLDRSDLGLSEWLTHLQEELMDAVNYIEKIKKVIDGVK